MGCSSKQQRSRYAAAWPKRYLLNFSPTLNFCFDHTLNEKVKVNIFLLSKKRGGGGIFVFRSLFARKEANAKKDVVLYAFISEQCRALFSLALSS